MKLHCKYTLFLFALVVCLEGYSQNLKPNFSFNSGYGFPLGNFNSKNLQNSKAGWANPGFSYGFDLNLRFGTTPLYACVAYKNIHNPIDFKTASTRVAGTYPGVDYHLTTDPWKSRSFLMGVSASLNFDSLERFSLSPRFLAGWMDLTPFVLNVTLPQSYSGSSSFPALAPQKGFAYLFGLNFRYVLYNTFFVSLNADYMHADVEFTSYVVTAAGQTTTTSTVPVDILNLSLGIGVKW